MKRISITVSGKVQGVFYRASTEKKAAQIGLTGFVRNEANGNVYIEVQGTEEKLDEFVKWCSRGPDGARVDKIITTGLPCAQENNFRIVRWL
ncbi:MAG: acylphosphatase [Bacteroidota bacterium]|nr:acylphosphatase [Bacteroidota bacterium]